jgi:hypothetical protein
MLLRILTPLIFLSLSCKACAQNVFPELFTGCNTDQFALEGDSLTAHHDAVKFVELLKVQLGRKTLDQLRGTLKLQVIVDLEGSSCLLSVENVTNKKTSKLRLKELVDKQVRWEPPSQKVAALIVLEFEELGIRYRRLGMNGKRGWHYIQ